MGKNENVHSRSQARSNDSTLVSGEVFEPSPDLSIGDRLSDRFRLKEILGAGGMGKVFRAHDPLLERDVAIKVILPQHFSKGMLKRFEREAKVLAMMKHENIINIYDFRMHGKIHYFVMDLIEGQTLASHLKKGTFSLGESLELCAQIADALNYSHGLEVYHRDVKPTNIMIVGSEGAFKAILMDFGLAKDGRDLHNSDPSKIVGSPFYMSPEQCEGRRLDGRTDLYSLGIVIYEFLAGTPPFSGNFAQLVKQIVGSEPPLFSEFGVVVEPRLQQLVTRALAKDPWKRHQSGDQMAQALRSYRATLSDFECTKHLTPKAVSVTANSPRPKRHADLTFVGRARERDILWKRLNLAGQNQCQFVIVSGGIGQGKTHLLRELDRWAQLRNYPVLWGRFPENEKLGAGQVFSEIVQSFYHHVDQMTVQQPNLSGLAADLIHYFPPLGLIKHLREMAKIDAVNTALSERGNIDILDLMTRAIRNLATEKPIVVLLENLPASGVGWEAINYIIRHLGMVPVLLVATYRNDLEEDRQALARICDEVPEAQFQRIDLMGLSTSEHREFLSTLLVSDQITPELLNRLFQRTEGNPFYTVEMVRALQKAKDLSQDHAGVWQLSDRAGVSGALTVKVRDAVMKRISQLPSPKRQVLAYAAVLGASFKYESLKALQPVTGDLSMIVDELIAEGFFSFDHADPEEDLFFASNIIRDVLYEKAHISRRKLHRLHAENLEQGKDKDTTSILADLIYHYLKGKVPEKAAAYAVTLTQQFLARNLWVDAQKAAEQGLKAIDKIGRGRKKDRGVFHLMLAQAYRGKGDVTGSLREAGTAFRALKQTEMNNLAMEAALLAGTTMLRVPGKADTRSKVSAVDWADRGLDLKQKGSPKKTVFGLFQLKIRVANLKYDLGTVAELEQQAAPYRPTPTLYGTRMKPEKGGTLAIAITTPLFSLQPGEMKISEEVEVAACVFETLLKVDEAGNLHEGLCRLPDDLSSGRGKHFRFQLRSGVCFSDQVPLTANHVKASLEAAARRCLDHPAPSFCAIEGFEPFAIGISDEISGIVVPQSNVIEFQLKEPLVFFPAMMTDYKNTAISRGSILSLGTGPFQLENTVQGELHNSAPLVLVPNKNYWQSDPPLIDRLELHTSIETSRIADGLLSGCYQLSHHLTRADLEDIQEKKGYRMVDIVKKNITFLLLNLNGSLTHRPSVRRALLRVIRCSELVPSALGRFAQHAVCLIPPGIMGHRANHHRNYLNPEQARKLLRDEGLALPVTLNAALHPAFLDRYRTFTDALLKIWERVGVSIHIVTDSMESYLHSLDNPGGVDLHLGRWNADYEDPHNFTADLFHSEHGLLKEYFSDPKADVLLEEARKVDLGNRAKLYYAFEALLEDGDILLPLFHDLDCRVAGPRVEGMELISSPPFVNYTRLWKNEKRPPSDHQERALKSGTIRIPLVSRLRNLDPIHINHFDYGEIMPLLYDSLFRMDSEFRVAPWLLMSYEEMDEGQRFYFRLRDNIHFHNRRRLTAYDVRFSFQRLIRHSYYHQALLPIEGWDDYAAGKAELLRGFEILSRWEFEIILTYPMPNFPSFLCNPATSILPERKDNLEGCSGDDWVGSGPFRIAEFKNGKQLDLVANTHYWRGSKYPACERLIFKLGCDPKKILKAFQKKEFDLVSSLSPVDTKILLDVGKGFFHETFTGLATYFIVLNTKCGPFLDRGVRRAFAALLKDDEAFARILGDLGKPAFGLVPPNLASYDEERVFSSQERTNTSLAGLSLQAVLNPAYALQFSAVWEYIQNRSKGADIDLKNHSPTVFYDMDSFPERVDLVAYRWIADTPDAHGFFKLFHSRNGLFGSMVGSSALDLEIEKARNHGGRSYRQRIYRGIERVIAEEVLLVPLFHQNHCVFAQPHVRGLRTRLGFPMVAYDQLSVVAK